ncbi:hypothetical protein ACA910_018292 [Epithemia clementina (nom. ined.)]
MSSPGKRQSELSNGSRRRHRRHRRNKKSGNEDNDGSVPNKETLVQARDTDESDEPSNNHLVGVTKEADSNAQTHRRIDDGTSESTAAAATKLKKQRKKKKRPSAHDGQALSGQESSVEKTSKEPESKRRNDQPKRHHPNKKRPRGNDTSTTIMENPFRDQLETFLSSRVTSSERDYFFSDQHVSPERRAELWAAQADVGEDLVNRYAWAVPNETCLTILRHFEPIIEIGCGANAYWCRQMKQAGIRVVGYDTSPAQGGRIAPTTVHRRTHQQSASSAVAQDEQNTSNRDDDGEFVVRQGGSEVLSHYKDHTLFLCYPDENDHDGEHKSNDDASSSSSTSTAPLGLACLQSYQGEYVIHVGEVYGDTLSMPQAPWGRSSSPDFQQQLAADFHCILKIPLVPSWIHVLDTLTVWKRSNLCSLVFADDDNDNEEATYRYIPPEERLPQVLAAPCLSHLLQNASLLSTSTCFRRNDVSEAASELKKRRDGFKKGSLNVGKRQQQKISSDEQEQSVEEESSDEDGKEDALNELKQRTASGSTSYQCPW